MHAHVCTLRYQVSLGIGSGCCVGGAGGSLRAAGSSVGADVAGCSAATYADRLVGLLGLPRVRGESARRERA